MKQRFETPLVIRRLKLGELLKSPQVFMLITTLSFDLLRPLRQRNAEDLRDSGEYARFSIGEYC